jgi:hypothetical protein
MRNRVIAINRRGVPLTTHRLQMRPFRVSAAADIGDLQLCCRANGLSKGRELLDRDSAIAITTVERRQICILTHRIVICAKTRIQIWLVETSEIREANYDLSLSRFKKAVYKEEEYDPPQVILERMRALNDEIASDIAELEEITRFHEDDRQIICAVPPVAAVPGLAGFEAWPWQGFVVPAKTPDAVIVKLHDTYIAAVADPVVRQKVIDAGAELLQSSPQEMADYMRKEAAKWTEVIRAANIQLD